MSKPGRLRRRTRDEFVKSGSTLIRRELREEEILRVLSGCLVGFFDGVYFDVPN